MRLQQLQVALAVVSVSFAACSNEDDQIRYVTELAGNHEVPAVTTTANGNFTLVDNGATMTWTLNVNQIQNVTQAHIHSGAAGQVGGVLVDLLPNGGPPATFTGGLLSTGTIDQSDIQGIGGAAPLSLDAFRALMQAGNAYVNVHTTANPDGHIRGQLRRDE